MILKDSRGEGYIEVAVFVMVAAFFIVFCLGVFEYFIDRQKLDFFAQEMIEAAAVFGKTSGPVEERYESLCEQLGIYPSCSFEGTEYFDEEQNTVQLGEIIRIELSLEKSDKLFGVFESPLVITSVKSGLSEQYWK